MKTFVINLDRCPERWLRISKNLDHEGFDFERISAIDGTKIENTSSYTSRFSRLLVHGGLSSTEVACYLSHVSVWRKIVTEEIPMALILEDDAVPLPGYRADIDNLNPESIGLHVIRLHIFNQKKVISKGQIKWSGITLNGHDIYLQIGLVSSATSYILTKEGAARLLNSHKIMSPVDWWSFHSLFCGLRHGICFPPLFTTDSLIESTVQSHGNEKIQRKRKVGHIMRRYLKRSMIPILDLAMNRKSRAAMRSAMMSRQSS